MDKKYEPSPEMKAKIEEIKNRIAPDDVRELRAEELEAVSGGDFSLLPFDPNKVVGGWTFKELSDLLGWTYESYRDPSLPNDIGKAITLDLANELLPHPAWNKYKNYAYPAFISKAMMEIWSEE